MSMFATIFFTSIMTRYYLLLLISFKFTHSALLNDICQTPNKEFARCVHIYSCPILIQTLADNSTEAVSFFRESTCGLDNGQQLVCCGTKSSRDPNIPPATPKPESTRKNWLPSRRICGWQHKDDRYYFKEETAIDEFPWMALLRAERNGKDAGYLCAGTVINRRHILTAAHCVQPPNDPDLKIVEVRLGEYNLRENDTDCVENPDYPECADPVVDVRVESIIVHPLYDHRSLVPQHDIAIIRMAENVQLSEYIRPICLPLANDTMAAVGDTLATSGWGIDRDKGKYTTIKKRGATKINDTAICAARLGGLGISTEASICSTDQGTEESTSCLGDSGAPAMFQHNIQWQQEGILAMHFAKSGGQLTCGPGTLSLYTKVSHYIDWIIFNVKP